MRELAPVGKEVAFDHCEVFVEDAPGVGIHHAGLTVEPAERDAVVRAPVPVFAQHLIELIVLVIVDHLEVACEDARRDLLVRGIEPGAARVEDRDAARGELGGVEFVETVVLEGGLVGQDGFHGGEGVCEPRVAYDGGACDKGKEQYGVYDDAGQAAPCEAA